MTQTAINWDGITFNRDIAEEAAEQGVAQACSLEYRRALLEYARGLAVSIATTKGTVTADDVRARWLVTQGPDEWDKLGNAVGSLFRGPQWRFTGRYVKSGFVSRHGAVIRVWELSR